VTSPHDLAFPYRPHILALVLVGALGAALANPFSGGGDRASDTLAIALVAALGYGTMRIFVRAAVRPLAARWPRLVLAWGLIWFYAVVPLSLIVLFVGSIEHHAPRPNAATIAFVVVAATSTAAGAFAAVRAARSSNIR
jgi:drug/metabolite transporter (DMT)-like permease